MGSSDNLVSGVKQLIRQLNSRLEQASRYQPGQSDDPFDLSRFYHRDSKMADQHMQFLKQQLAQALGKRVEDLTPEDFN